MVDNIQPRSLSCFRIRKRRHKNRMDLRRAKTQEPLNMTWAGKQSEQPRSFQSPETYLLLTFPFIERGYRRCGVLELDLAGFPTNQELGIKSNETTLPVSVLASISPEATVPKYPVQLPFLPSVPLFGWRLQVSR